MRFYLKKNLILVSIFQFFSICLFAQNPNPKGITIITHGFELSGEFNPYWYNFAAAIKQWSGADATIYTNNEQGQWAKLSNSSFNSSRYGYNGNGNPESEIIFVLNWANISNKADGYLESAADHLFAMLANTPMELNFPSGGIWNSTKPIHIIGHSRGTILNLQLCHRALKYFPSRLIDQYTSLDPHPANGATLINDVNIFSPLQNLPGVNGSFAYKDNISIQVPINVVKTDNYFRKDGSYELGVDFDGVSNISAGNFNRQLKNNYLDGSIFTDISNIAHSNLHLWYLGTVDTSLTAPYGFYETINGNLDISYSPKFNETRDSTGFYFSRLGGGFNSLPSSINTISISDMDSQIAYRSNGKLTGLQHVFNGHFDYNVAGWERLIGNDLSLNAIESDEDNYFLKLNQLALIATHNWIYFPPTFEYLTFNSKSNDITLILGIKFIDGDKNTIFSTQLLINNLDEFKDYFVKIPDALKGKTGTFSLELVNDLGDLKRIYIDDIDLTNNAPTPVASITALGETTFCNSSQTVQLKASTINPDYEYQWQKNGSNIAVATDSIYLVDSEGDYTLKVTSKSTALFAISDSVKVSYKELTDYTVGGGGTVQVGEAIALEATGGDHYLWQGPNGFVSYLQSPVIYNATSAANGYYTLEITNANGCTATASIVVNIVQETGNSASCPPLIRSVQQLPSGWESGTYVHTQPFLNDKFIAILDNSGVRNLTLLDSSLNIIWKISVQGVSEITTDDLSIYLRYGNTITKYSSTGSLLWTTTPSIKIIQSLRTTTSNPYSSTTTNSDIYINSNIVSMAQSSDGGIAILFKGYSYKNKTSSTSNVLYEYSYTPINNNATDTEDYYIAKIDANGIVSWFKSYGDVCVSENPIKIKSTRNGGFVIMGKSCNNVLKVFRIDSNGNSYWNSSLTLSNSSDTPITVSEAIDGGALVGMQIYRNNQQDMWFGKISSNGILQWQKTFGGSTTDPGWPIIDDYIFDIEVDANSDFLISGIHYSADDVMNSINSYPHFGWLSKISSNGTIYWNKKYSSEIRNIFLRGGKVSATGVNGVVNFYDLKNASFQLNSVENICNSQSIDLKFSDDYLYNNNYTKSYWYKNGKKIDNLSTNARSFNQDGTYHAKIEMTNGCSVVTPPVTIVTPKVSSNAIYVYNTDDNGYQSTSNGLCEGATLNLTAEGGDSYAWTGPNGFVSNEQSPSIPNVTEANSGTYDVTIINTMRNCNVTLSTEVNVVAEILNEFTIRSPIEEGEHTSFYYCCDYGNPLSAKITGPNGYINNNPIGAGFDWYDVSLKQAGTYTIQKQVGNCIKTYTQNLVVNPCPLNPVIRYEFQKSSSGEFENNLLNSSGTNSFCIKNNTKVSLAAQGNSSNNVSGYKYQWYLFGVPIANATNSHININQSGTYGVKVIRNGRCERMSPNYVINVNFEPEFTTNIPTPKPICQGQGFTFQASPQTNNYQWTGPDNFNTNGHTIAVTNVQPSRSGNYTVKATNSAGCSTTKQFNFQVESIWNPIPALYDKNGRYYTSEEERIYKYIEGDSIALGVAFYYPGDKFYWEGPVSFYKNFVGLETSTFFPLKVSNGGIYTLTRESINGCIGKSSLTLKVPNIEIISEKSLVCKGEMVSLYAKNCNGTILWSNGAIGDNLNRNLFIYPELSTIITARCKIGDYIGPSCDPIQIEVYSDPPKPIISADNYSVCYPDVVTLRSSGCSYQTSWSPYNSTVTDSVLNLNLGVGSHNLAFSCNSEYGCGPGIASDSITVNLYNKPSTPSIEGIPQSSYPAGQEVTLVANHYGSPTDTLIWSNGMRGNSITVSPIITTTYTVYAKNAGGCISDISQPVIITINGALPLTIQAITSEVCAGSIVNLSATGCSGTVLWSTGHTGLSISTTINTTTIYTASCLINGSNVSISNELSINVVSRLPTPQIQANKAAIGEGESVTLTAQGCTNTIKWSNGDTGNTITVFPSNNSSYRAICTYDAFCESDSSNRIDILVTPFIDCNFFQNVRVRLFRGDYSEYADNKIPKGTTVAITGNIYNLEYGYLPIKWLVKNLANEIIDSISNSRQINVICSEPLNITASIKSGQCENVSVLYLGVDETVNIGCYALNGNALDESERNVDGQILGNVLPTTDRFNNPNSALYFPGNMNSWVKVFPPLPIQPSFTINAWVYREEGSSYYVLGQGSKDVSTGWFGLICGDGGSQKPGFGVKYGSHNPEIAYAYSDESLQNNQWYMLTGVVDSKNHKIKFYVNGSFKGENVYPFENSLRVLGLPFSLGRNTAYPYDLENYGTWETYPFKGKVDDICIRNIALTDIEVKTLYYLANCSETVNLLGNNYLNEINAIKIKANKDIFSSSLIQNSNIEFKAGKSINLEPGFKVEKGAIFKAILGGCAD